MISGNDQDGVEIIGASAYGNMVYSNTIGTNITGTFAISNTSSGIYIASAPKNKIGAAGMGNLISGNGQNGVDIDYGAHDNLVLGNLIGTNISGSAGIPNQLYGILVSDAPTNTIGGTNSQEGNIISANLWSGIYFLGSQANGNLVLGNKIGTNKAGSAALGNQRDGIYFSDGSSRNTIGGGASGAGNLISGNFMFGVEIDGSETRYNKLLGNKIGTNLAGTSAIPNSNDGIFLDPARDTIIGGAAAGEGNLISGNGGNGIYIFGDDSFYNTILGNKIGTNLSGSAALENGLCGISLNNAPRNTIGGTTAGSGNLISGNHMDGVQIINTEASRNVLYGNVIGLAASGTFTIPNEYSGITIQDAISTTIGGIEAGQANTISGNLQKGVNITEYSAEALYNRVSGNHIYNNGSLGIDLKGNGVTPNDNLDADNGPNGLQNFPVILFATVPNTSLYEISYTVIAGELNSTISTTFTIEFYSSPTCDPSGYGEGQVFLGAKSVTTNASGKVNYTFDTNYATTVGEFMTAIAIDPQGNTSEFSACRRIDAALLYLPVIRK